MKLSTTFNGTRRLISSAALVGAVLVGSGPTATATVSQADPTVLAPARVATVAETKCGPQAPGVECKGWDGIDIRSETTLFVVGFENNQDSNQKHVLQTVASFDLGPAKSAVGDGKVAQATLSYSEASTTRRSAAGDSEYGILPTCNTQLGVPTAPWNGNQDKIISVRSADIAGVTGATTGESGSWDVTPQVTRWLQAGTGQGTFVLRSEDESLSANGQAMCLSYVMDLALTVEVAPATAMTAPAAPASTQAMGSAPAPGSARTGSAPQTEQTDTLPTLRLGDSSVMVATLHYLLRQRGATMEAEVDFTPGTEAAVRAYQQANGLPADGIVGRQTWQALFVTVKRGDRGEAVSAVQHRLGYEGFLEGDGDFAWGSFDAATDAAVRAYQQANGLPADGVVGVATWAKLVANE